MIACHMQIFYMYTHKTTHLFENILKCNAIYGVIKCD